MNKNNSDTGLRLVIAEKPSVAQSIARVIGADQRKDGYLEGNGYLVSWCIGHLVELAMPETYNEAFTKWKYEDLPILPQFMDSGWQYQIADTTKKQFGILKKLMHRDDVISLICATDAAREGELIYRLVYQQAGYRSPDGGHLLFRPIALAQFVQAIFVLKKRKNLALETAIGQLKGIPMSINELPWKNLLWLEDRKTINGRPNKKEMMNLMLAMADYDVLTAKEHEKLLLYLCGVRNLDSTKQEELIQELKNYNVQ